MEITNYKGYTIQYDMDRKVFYVLKDGERIVEAPTQTELEGLLNAFLKKGFQRIPAIRIKYKRVVQGEITSTTLSSHYGSPHTEIWFVDENKIRDKTRLYQIYEVTPANLNLMAHINALYDQSNKIEGEINKLTTQFTNPINEGNIKKLAGLE